jgi:hypothetical protein
MQYLPPEAPNPETADKQVVLEKAQANMSIVKTNQHFL